MLLGTEKNGVLVWDGRTLARYHPALAGLEVTALAGSEPDLWIGTIDRGVFRWHAGQLDHFSEGARAAGSASSVARGATGTPPTRARHSESRNSRTADSLACWPRGFFAKALLVKERIAGGGNVGRRRGHGPAGCSRRPRMRNISRSSGASRSGASVGLGWADLCARARRFVPAILRQAANSEKLWTCPARCSRTATSPRWMWIAPAGSGLATSIAGWMSWMRVSSALRILKMSMFFASTGSCTPTTAGLSAVAHSQWTGAVRCCGA